MCPLMERKKDHKKTTWSREVSSVFIFPSGSKMSDEDKDHVDNYHDISSIMRNISRFLSTSCLNLSIAFSVCVC